MQGLSLITGVPAYLVTVTDITLVSPSAPVILHVCYRMVARIPVTVLGGATTNGTAATSSNGTTGAATGGGGAPGGTQINSNSSSGSSDSSGGSNKVTALTFNPSVLSPVALSNSLGAAVLSPPPGIAFSVAANSVSYPTRAGVCGNGVCEVGERCVLGHLLSPDCPFTFVACPVSAGAAGAVSPCAGRGRCLPQSGSCVCNAAYGGVGCDICAPSFVRWRGVCVPEVDVALLGPAVTPTPVPPAAVPPAPWWTAPLVPGVATPIVIGVAPVVLCAVCCICAFLVWRRRRARRGGKKTSLGLLVPPAGEEMDTLVTNPLHGGVRLGSAAAAASARGGSTTAQPSHTVNALLASSSVYAAAAARGGGGATLLERPDLRVSPLAAAAPPLQATHFSWRSLRPPPIRASTRTPPRA